MKDSVIFLAKKGVCIEAKQNQSNSLSGKIMTPDGWRQDYVVFELKTLTNYRNKLKSLLSKEPYKGLPKSIFVNKWSTISLEKIKGFASKNNIKLNKGYNHVDTIILSYTYVERVLNLLLYADLDDVYIKEINLHNDINILLKKLNLDNNMFFESENLKSFIDYNKNKITSSYFLFNDNKINQNEIKELIELPLSNPSFTKATRIKNYDISRKEKFFKLLDYLIENPDVKVMWDYELMNLISKGGLTTDEVDLSTLEQMLTNNDSDNIALAIEILSGFNLEKDFIKISILLNEGHPDISRYYLSQKKPYKYINHYLKNKNIRVNLDWSDFINKTLPLYPEHKELFENYYIKMYNKMGGIRDYRYYYLKKNLTYKIKKIEFEL